MCAFFLGKEKAMEKQFKKGDLLTLDIIDLTNEGLGVGKKDNFTIFVDGGLPGDVAKVKLTEVKKNFARGEAIQIIEPSKDRIVPRCEYFKKCGGCQLQELGYRAQLKLKTNIVKNAIERIGKLEGVKVNETIGMENPFRYRNKGEFKVGNGFKGTSIGYFRQKSHDIVQVESCIIQNDVSDKVIKIVKDFMKEYNISAYNERNKTGIIRHVLTRIAKDGKTMVVIVTASNKLPHSEEFVNKITNNIDNVVSIYQNINTRSTSMVLGEKNIKLYGEDRIVDWIGNFKFYISPNSFFQVNSIQTEVLYGKALEYLDLKGGETVFDLYCGIGTISLFLSQKAKKVYGVEVVEAAILDAKENAKLNGVKNVEFFHGTSEEIFPSLLKKGIHGDAVVVDPPRKGCEKEVLNAIVKMNPKKVVYVSCNPATLARDLKYLGDNGYEVAEVQPVDMFPFTGHVECVGLMSRVEK